MILATVPQVSAYLIAGTVDAGFINITDALGIQDKIVAGFDEIPPALYDPPLIVLAVPRTGPNHRQPKRSSTSRARNRCKRSRQVRTLSTAHRPFDDHHDVLAHLLTGPVAAQPASCRSRAGALSGRRHRPGLCAQPAHPVAWVAGCPGVAAAGIPADCHRLLSADAIRAAWRYRRTTARVDRLGPGVLFPALVVAAFIAGLPLVVKPIQSAIEGSARDLIEVSPHLGQGGSRPSSWS